VILREIEGFAYEEIAEILNVNLGTIKSRLTRGRSALRALLVNKSVIAPETSAPYPITQTSDDMVTR
jgi:RNA polymerase sigma-70 factor (ECF subfamily)